MKVYTLQETDYSDLEESLECIMHKAKKFLEKMESGDFGSRRGMGWRDEEDDDYDWKVKKGRYSGRY